MNEPLRWYEKHLSRRVINNISFEHCKYDFNQLIHHQPERHNWIPNYKQPAEVAPVVDLRVLDGIA